MCILMLLYKRIKDYPIVIAANRDEYYDRPAQGPQLLGEYPKVWGGRDIRAHGTWLGVNSCGLVVGLTNRRQRNNRTNDPERRSRGLVCLEALRYRTASEAVSSLFLETRNYYNPFNMLAADETGLWWIAYHDKPYIYKLKPGLHILANGNINDFNTIRIRRVQRLTKNYTDITLQELLPLLEDVCRDHETAVQDHETICMHRAQENYGTVSSTLLALHSTKCEKPHVYYYAEGHPCTIPYQDYSSLLE